MSRPRDSQRIKVYRAGWEFEALLPDRWMLNVRSIQAWVDGIINSAWWQAPGHFALTMTTGVIIKDGRGRRTGRAWATYDGGVITLPRKLRHEGCILHELAHLMTPRNAPGHGPEFVQAWLALVDEWMGALEGAALRWFLAKNRVKWEEPCEQK